MTNKQKLNFDAFLAEHPVFRLDELAAARGQPDQLNSAHNQLKYHIKHGRVLRLARGVFAAMPWNQSAEHYQPDPILVAAALRPDGIFSHHTALQLLGAAHSLWNLCTLFCAHPLPARAVGAQRIQFLVHPTPLLRKGDIQLGSRRTERHGRPVLYTGPERTLLEGFRQPRWVGGLEELLESASGFGVLDLNLLHALLTTYDQSNVWAATGWFLERYQQEFFVPDIYLAEIEKNKPEQPTYLARNERGGTLQSRWNLIVPEYLLAWEGQHAQL